MQTDDSIGNYWHRQEEGYPEHKPTSLIFREHHFSVFNCRLSGVVHGHDEALIVLEICDQAIIFVDLAWSDGNPEHRTTKLKYTFLKYIQHQIVSLIVDLCFFC